MTDNTRRCILSGERADPDGLIRLALGPGGQVAPDVRGKAPGRGAWIGVDRGALEQAMAKGRLKAAFARAFKTGPIAIPDDLPAMIDQALERAFLDRLGLEARGGTLLTGSDRIAESARRGNVVLLLHAGDAASDGARKLDQAWRVGQEREGSGDTGLLLPVGRDALSKATGRDNVVHVAITDEKAAARINAVLARWQSYRGCANAPAYRAPDEGDARPIAVAEDEADGVGGQGRAGNDVVKG